jgi:hypothetical protein
MATTMLAAGVPVPVVSERHCHARTSTTGRILGHDDLYRVAPKPSICRDWQRSTTRRAVEAVCVIAFPARWFASSVASRRSLFGRGGRW